MVKAVEIHRISSGKPQAETVTDSVATEQAVSILVEDVDSFTVLCTPVDVEALAAGFVFSEGLIAGKDDIIFIEPSESDPNVVGIKVEEPERVTTKQKLIVAS